MKINKISKIFIIFLLLSIPFTAWALPPQINILGNNPLNISVGTIYFDPGAQAIDPEDGDLSASIVGQTNVNWSLAGEYFYQYFVVDSDLETAVATRTIYVYAPVILDTVRPEIFLAGENPFYLTQGQLYIDPGASSTDDVDGDISHLVTGYHNVLFSAPGTYSHHYFVSDSAGNTASTTRTVVVTALDTLPPRLELLGANPMSVQEGEIYTDPGASSTDDMDGDLSGLIDSYTTVNFFVPGTYHTYYSVSDLSGNTATATRTVTVTALDRTAPILEIMGENPMSIQEGEAYNDPGASSTDNVDGDISALISDYHNVISSVPGTYSHYYSVSDSAGNIATATRTVIVTANTISPPSGGGGSSGGGGGGGGGSSAIVPSMVSSATAQRSSSSVSLIWTNPAANFTKTIIIRSSEALADFIAFEAAVEAGETIYEGTDQAFSDTAILPNLTYYYYIYTNYRTKYSRPLVFEKAPLIPEAVKDESGQSQAGPEPVSQNQPRYDHLGGISGDLADRLSLGEAQLIRSSRNFVVLSETARRLYDFLYARRKANLSEDEKYALAFYLQSGTPTTVKLGVGERAGVVNSYLSAFNKLPRSEKEWQDVVKIANGRWPEERSQAAEFAAKQTRFFAIYKRVPDMENPHDNAAVTVISYGLRPALRNLESERNAIRIFKAIFSYQPVSALDWDMVRAIAYSGAVR